MRAFVGFILIANLLNSVFIAVDLYDALILNFSRQLKILRGL